MRIPIADDYLLRPWTMDDVPSVARYANNRKVWRNLRDAFPHPYSEDDARAFIGELAGRQPAHHLRHRLR